MKIGEKIRLARHEKGFTQVEFAEKLGISRSAIACYETERRTPDFKDLQHIAAVLGVSVGYFADSTPENEILDFIMRANALFSNVDISVTVKDKVFNDIMKIYVNTKN